MKQLNDLRYEGMRITFIDVDNKYLKQFGKAVDGTYAPGIAPSNFSKSFTDAYQKKYNKIKIAANAMGTAIIELLLADCKFSNCPP